MSTVWVSWIECPLSKQSEKKTRSRTFAWFTQRTTDTQRGNSLHCTAENSIPIPNFLVWPKHILSATLAQFFRYLWFMPSLGVRSLWSRLKNSSVKVVYKQLVVVIHGNVKKQQKFFQISWIITKKHLVYKLRNSMDPKK